MNEYDISFSILGRRLSFDGLLVSLGALRNRGGSLGFGWNWTLSEVDTDSGESA